MDARLRELERMAQATGANTDWDAYLVALQRSGDLSQRIAEITSTFPTPSGGPVSEGDYQLLGRLLSYQYRNNLLSLPALRNLLGDWDTGDMRRAVLGLPPEQYGGAGNKMREDLQGFFWITPTTADWVVNRMLPWLTERGLTPADLPHWFPVRLFAAGQTPPMRSRQVKPLYFHRLFMLCPLCRKEIPTGRLWNHFTAVDHGAPERPRRRPPTVVMDMLYRRREELLGPRYPQANFSMSGGVITVTLPPDLLEPIQSYLAGLNWTLRRQRESLLPGKIEYEFSDRP